MSRFHYSLYGLGILSEIELAGARPGDGREDLAIRYGRVDAEPPETIEVYGYYALDPGHAHYVWRGVGKFSIVEGRRIIIDAEPGADERDIAMLLLGQFIAIAMHQRGRLILHASAVEKEGKVLAFMGESGKGKSTTATAFVREGGCRLVSDDLLVVELVEGGAIVHPGGPQVKLWPEVITAFGGDPASFPNVMGLKDKRALGIEDLVPEVPLPLRGLYALADGEECEIVPLVPGEALVELIRHSYCALLLDRMNDRRRHFLQCARLASLVPVQRLVRKGGLENLPEIVRMVLYSLHSRITPPPTTSSPS